MPVTWLVSVWWCRCVVDVDLAVSQPTFLSSLAAVLADVSKSQVARMAAGLQLKNCLTSKDQDVRQAYQQRWLTIELPVRQHIKGLVWQWCALYLESGHVELMQVLATLGTEQQQHRAAAQCIAYIAAVELQVNQWPELIPALLANVTSPQSTEQLKEASLEAIGYICEDLVCGNESLSKAMINFVMFVSQDPKFLANQANEILTAVVQGMRKEEPSNNVRLAATKALLNSLEFTKANFEKEVCFVGVCVRGMISECVHTHTHTGGASLYHASGV